MIFNFKNKRPASWVVLISLCSLFCLASCADDCAVESADTSPTAERQPEQLEEATDSVENRSEQLEEATDSVENRSEQTEEATASIDRRPARTEQPIASIERYSAHARLSGSSVWSTELTERSGAAAGSSPVMADDTNRINKYNVVLGVDETIKIPGRPGELRVWIGSPEYQPDFPERMTQDEATIPAVGESAKVEPFAPAFTIEPAETQCIRIHPSGSEVRFKLIPQKQGSFEVGANVYLFDSLDCSGSPIPKTAATLKVLVEVDRKQAFLEKLNELWHVLWDKFVEFWAALLVIFFGLILFLIRGKLKRRFGYGDS